MNIARPIFHAGMRSATASTAPSNVLTQLFHSILVTAKGAQEVTTNIEDSDDRIIIVCDIQVTMADGEVPVHAQKRGLLPNETCECGMEEQTSDHILHIYPMYRPPHRLCGLVW